MSSKINWNIVALVCWLLEAIRRKEKSGQRSVQKNRKLQSEAFGSFGARDGIRTHGLLITNQLRYRLRHSSII